MARSSGTARPASRKLPAAKSDKDQPRPLVMLAQPSGAVIVQSEQLREWERHVITWAQASVKIAIDGAGTCCWTPSGSPRRADDSDYD